MIRITGAIFSNGVLRPTEPLPLQEHQRVKITVEEVDSAAPADRAAAVRRFLEGVERSRFRSAGRYPTRDELHERR